MLSEADSKRLIRRFGIPTADERIAPDVASAVQCAKEVGFPVAVKLSGTGIAHKTERGLVRLALGDEVAVRSAAESLLAQARPEDGLVELLVSPMLGGSRELIAGAVVDAQFGPTVLLGIGGVLAEAVDDAVIRLAPITEVDALEMIDSLRLGSLLGAFRGEPAVDRVELTNVLLGLSKLITSEKGVTSVDVNPLIVVDGMPVAVDALVETGGD